MFRTLFDSFDHPDDLFAAHPAELAVRLDVEWDFAKTHDPDKPLGHPDHRSDLLGLRDISQRVLNPPSDLSAAPVANIPGRRHYWDHLIYAYMIENTCAFDVFEHVVREFAAGEELGTPSESSEHWLRNTEELFYNDPAAFLISRVSSRVRPDLRATRRNAYQRMFGMDLNHGVEDKKDTPTRKPGRATPASCTRSRNCCARSGWRSRTWATRPDRT